MQGIIKDCGADGRRFAVTTRTGYIIFYAEDTVFDWGDIVEGDFSTHGPTVLHNHRTGRTLAVYIEVIGTDSSNIDFHLNLRR